MTRSEFRRWLVLCSAVTILVPCTAVVLAVINSDEPALQIAAT